MLWAANTPWSIVFNIYPLARCAGNLTRAVSGLEVRTIRAYTLAVRINLLLVYSNICRSLSSHASDVLLHLGILRWTSGDRTIQRLRWRRCRVDIGILGKPRGRIGRVWCRGARLPLSSRLTNSEHKLQYRLGRVNADSNVVISTQVQLFICRNAPDVMGHVACRASMACFNQFGPICKSRCCRRRCVRIVIVVSRGQTSAGHCGVTHTSDAHSSWIGASSYRQRSVSSGVLNRISDLRRRRGSHPRRRG